VKEKHGGDAGAGEKRPSRAERQRAAARMRRSGTSSGRIALIIAVVGLVLIVLFIIPRGQEKTEVPLARAGSMTGSPINNVDPTSGKPIVAGITSTYKGYTIGHCCATSKAEFEALSPAQKEKAVRRFLK
jgi:hypothetical protein